MTEKLADKVGQYVEQYVEAMEKVINALNSTFVTQSLYFSPRIFCVGIIFLSLSVQVKLKQGLKTAMSISSEGNAYLQVSMADF